MIVKFILVLCVVLHSLAFEFDPGLPCVRVNKLSVPAHCGLWPQN